MKLAEIANALSVARGALLSFRRVTEPARSTGLVLIRVEKGEAVFVRKEKR